METNSKTSQSSDSRKSNNSAEQNTKLSASVNHSDNQCAVVVSLARKPVPAAGSDSAGKYSGEGMLQQHSKIA